MRITALQPQTKDPERLNLFVDGQFLMGINVLIALQMHLKVGQELTQQQVEQLRQEEALQQAVARALNYLSFRPRSRGEVRRYLQRKETPLELIDRVLERLERLDLINDQAFAEFWIESRTGSNPKGARAIKNELRQKGVTREIVDEMVNDEQDEERARHAARKKAQSLVGQSGMDFKTFRLRLGPFLQRRGFSYEIATRTVRELWQELTAENDNYEDDGYEEGE
jgi:regulatory protein